MPGIPMPFLLEEEKQKREEHGVVELMEERGEVVDEKAGME